MNNPTRNTRSAFFALWMRGAALLVVGVAAWMLMAAPLHAQVALRADTVHTMTGDPIINGVVLIEGSTIADVGPADAVDIPDGATVYEGTVATPGLVDPRGTVGLSGIYNVDSDQDQLDTTAPMQPELRAIDAYNPQEELVAFLRDQGITTVHTGHGPGALISGQTATFKTTGETVDDAALSDISALSMTMGSAATEQFSSPGTRAKGASMLRDMFLQAERYRDADDDRDRDLAMEVLVQVLDGEIPAFIQVHRSHDILTALRLADEFGFDLVLEGASEAYLVTDEIAEAGVPVVLHPPKIRPFGAAENAQLTTAGELHAAGIPVAIQSGYEAYVPKTRVVLFEAGIAAANGLPHEAALASITRTAAEIIGQSDVIGTLEPGKHGDVALYNGNPFEYVTNACTVVIEGEVVKEDGCP